MMECLSNVCELLYCSNNYNCNSPPSKPRECKNGICVPKTCNGEECEECNDKKKCDKPFRCIQNRCQVMFKCSICLELVCDVNMA